LRAVAVLDYNGADQGITTRDLQFYIDNPRDDLASAKYVDYQDELNLSLAKDYTDTALTSYETIADVDAKLADYDTIADVDAKLTYYDKTSDVDSKLSKYDTIDDVDAKLANYDTIDDVDSKLLGKLNDTDTLTPVSKTNKILTEADTDDDKEVRSIAVNDYYNAGVIVRNLQYYIDNPEETMGSTRYLDHEIHQTEINCNLYTDDEVDIASTASNTYTDEQAANTLSSAKAYTDMKISSVVFPNYSSPSTITIQPSSNYKPTGACVIVWLEPSYDITIDSSYVLPDGMYPVDSTNTVYNNSTDTAAVIAIYPLR
jgi:hypothetical protein